MEDETVVLNSHSPTGSSLSIGDLLEDSCKMVPKIFMTLLPLIVTVAVLAGFSGGAEDTGEIPGGTSLLKVVCGLASGLIGFYVNIVAMQLANSLWAGESPSREEAMKRVSFSTYMTVAAIGLWVGVGTMIGLLLLIIPGIIFVTNRYFSVVVCVLENRSFKESIERSKEIFQSKPMLDSKGPFLSAVFLTIAYVIVSFIIGIGFGFVALGLAMFGSLSGVLAQILGALINEAVSLVWVAALIGLYRYYSPKVPRGSAA